MHGIDKLRKVLIIIFTTLSIIALVFSLAKKVGLCASDQTSVGLTGYPLPYGVGSHFGYGNYPLTNEIVSDCVNKVLTGPYASWFSNGYVLVVKEVPQDLSYIKLTMLGLASDGTFISSIAGNYPSFDSNSKVNYSFTNICDIYYNSSSGDASVSFANNVTGTQSLNLRSYLVGNPDLSYSVPMDTLIPYYPIGFTSNAILTYNGNTIFGNSHSVGGGLAEYSDQVQEFIDSDINSVDTTSPSDPTSTPSWLQKILHGIGSLNNTIGGGFSLVQNGINSITGSKLFSFFGAFYDLGDSGNGFSVSTFLHNLFFCSPQTIVSIWNNSQTGASVTALKNCASNVISCYNATPSDHVYWTFDFSNTILGSAGVITIDFDWYNNIRTQVITVFSVFFVLGFIFLWLRKLPGIISGASSNSDDK